MWLQSDVAGVGVILKALSFSSLMSSLRGFRQLVVETAGALRATLSLSPWTLHIDGLRETGLFTWCLKAQRGTVPRETSRGYVAFSNLASEVTHMWHFCNILFIRTVTEAPLGTRNGDTDTAF